MKTAGRNVIYSNWMIIPGMILVVVFLVLPNIAQFILAMTDWNLYDFHNMNFVGFENFKQMLSEPTFLVSVKNTFYFSILSVLLKTVIGFILALIVNMNIKFKEVYRAIFFLPFTLSIMVVGGAFSAIYHPEGILNQFLRLVGLGSLAQEWIVNTHYAMNSVVLMDVWSGAGFTMVIFIAGLQTIPEDIYESSIIDGAGGFKKLISITLPLVMPSITINTSLNIIGSLKVFGQVLVLTNGGPADATQVFSTFIYKNFGYGFMGYASAISLVFTIIVTTLGILANTAFRKMEVEY